MKMKILTISTFFTFQSNWKEGQEQYSNIFRPWDQQTDFPCNCDHCSLTFDGGEWLQWLVIFGGGGVMAMKNLKLNSCNTFPDHCSPTCNYNDSGEGTAVKNLKVQFCSMDFLDQKIKNLSVRESNPISGSGGGVGGQMTAVRPQLQNLSKTFPLSFTHLHCNGLPLRESPMRQWIWPVNDCRLEIVLVLRK